MGLDLAIPIYLLGLSWLCFRGWGPLARLALYGAFLMCAEWCAYEVFNIFAGGSIISNTI